jgi:hypothetical protein
MKTIFGKTVRGKAIRAALIALFLYLDIESPGYLKFKNPIEPLLTILPVENALECPRGEIATIPPIIPLTKALGSKSASVEQISAKLGSPICKKDSDYYWKVETLGQKLFLRATIKDDGSVASYKFYKND